MMDMLVRNISLLTLLFCSQVFAQFHDPRALEANPLLADSPIAPRLEGLGDVGFKVTTGNADSQYYFNQGLRLTYAFNHSEALRAFKESARLDPDNAMAWWGQALVLGPNINLPMMPYVTDAAWAAMQEATARQSPATKKEKALIAALAQRYRPEVSANRIELDRAYADAMLKLAGEYASDPDIAALTASALMNLSPWDYWFGDGKPYERTVVIMALLEGAIAKSPKHTGALHYHIHVTESKEPDLGEPSADALKDLAPGAGHLLHMPSHIYMRVGRYADAYAMNQAATKADVDYIAQCQAQGLYPVGYYPHNAHFMVWSAQFMGRYADAIAAARDIRDKIPEFIGVEDQLPTNVKSDAWVMFETFLSQPLFTMTRFGDWEAVLEEPKPDKSALFMTGIWHYARGMARVHTGQPEAARMERESLRRILVKSDIDNYAVSLNGAKRLLEIAEKLLSGEIAASNGNYERAIALMSGAVRLQDGLLYMEPPDWFFPSRHYLGAVLLEAGKADEAETVYWADLSRNPENGFALFGLMQAQTEMGNAEAADLSRMRFERAWINADVELANSRF
ncbi:MAG: hypothetical protein OEU86_07255 [Gammaproteobacteria bacterium]|nr:hypothetical protein [Gammaproteobacteria bacterium]